jgi:hypothetical protein
MNWSENTGQYIQNELSAKYGYKDPIHVKTLYKLMYDLNTFQYIVTTSRQRNFLGIHTKTKNIENKNSRTWLMLKNGVFLKNQLTYAFFAGARSR